MKRFTILLALLLVATACAPAPVAFPTPVPTATAVPTATPVTFPTPLPTPTPYVLPPDDMTLFEPGDVQVFIKDQDVTESFVATGGYYRDGNLIMWADLRDEGALPDNAHGVMYLKANSIPIRYGGLSFRAVGQAFVTNYDGGDQVQGVSQWDLPAGEHVIKVKVLVPTTGHSALSELSYSPDWPYNWHYGLHVYVSIAVP